MAETERTDQEWALQRRIEDVFVKLGEKYGDLTGRVETKIKSTVTFDDVGGLRQAKTILKGFALALTAPDLYRQWGIEPPKGILLYGPPGTGKSKLAQALATTSGAIFYHLKLMNLTSKFAANTGDLMQEILKIAMGEGPAALFLDEAEALSLDHLLPPPHAREASARAPRPSPPMTCWTRSTATRACRAPWRRSATASICDRVHEDSRPLQGHGLHEGRLLRQLPHLLRGGSRRVPPPAGARDVSRRSADPPAGRGGAGPLSQAGAARRPARGAVLGERAPAGALSL